VDLHFYNIVVLGKEWVAAEVKHDVTLLQRILDDKFVASFGAKKTILQRRFHQANMQRGCRSHRIQTLTDETVIIDRDTAVVVGSDTRGGQRKGRCKR